MIDLSYKGMGKSTQMITLLPAERIFFLSANLVGGLFRCKNILADLVFQQNSPLVPRNLSLRTGNWNTFNFFLVLLKGFRNQ